jgi:excisionase family DNA binding protein
VPTLDPNRSTPDQEPLLLRPRDVERLTTLGRTRVGELLRSGAIPSLTCGRLRLVRREDLLKWVASQVEREWP